jgi:hypothetical protein
MSQTILQIALLLISGVAVFSFVMPTFSEIRGVQDETAEYALALENAYQSKQRLDSLVNTMEGYSAQEQYRLDLFIPNEIDIVRLSYDLEMLIEKQGLFLNTFTVEDEEKIPDPVSTSAALSDSAADEFGTAITEERTVASQDMVISLSGTYPQFKAFLASVEQSAQLIDVVSVSFENTDSDIIQFEVTLRTYGLFSKPDLTIE